MDPLSDLGELGIVEPEDGTLDFFNPAHDPILVPFDFRAMVVRFTAGGASGAPPAVDAGVSAGWVAVAGSGALCLAHGDGRGDRRRLDDSVS
jgi:hypothetical protein